jgi:DNA-binding IclR family transcriptional regulator
MAPFLETVYRLKARDEYRTAMMMAVDEADAIAPQRPFKGEERMLGAMEDVIRRGGQRGIGCIMATQRPAVLNKNVLTQSQILIALRLIAPQDRDALEAWIEIHGTKAQQETLMDSLGSLPTGTAWFWSPGWPDEAGIFKRVQVGQRTTFDSFRTPAPGEKRLEPKTLADVDLEALRKRMAATIERAKAEDPKELRKQLAEARAALAKAQKAQPAPAVSAEPKIVKVPILKDKQLSRLEKILTRLDAIRTRTGEELLSLKPMVDSITGAIAKSKAPVPIPYQAPQVRASMPAPAKTVRQPADCQSTDLGKGELCILTAVAQYPDGIIREQLTVMTGYRRSSRDTYLQRLRSGGLVEDRAGRIVATEAGVASLGPDFEPLPTGEALREHLMATLPEGERRILGFLIEKYPKEVSREEIDEATGYKRSSRDTYLQRLSARRLWESVAGKIRAAEVLFQEG